MGGVLVLEAVTVPAGSTSDMSEDNQRSERGGGNLRCTGRLGEVIQESADLALTWVKANALGLGVQGKMRGVDIHVSTHDREIGRALGDWLIIIATSPFWIY